MGTKPLTTIYIARHGETLWNTLGLMQGVKDSPLTENGIQQAKDLASNLKDIHFDAVFASDLLRAKRTAEIVALEKELTVETTEALREQNFGRFEGTSFEKMREELKDLYAKYETMTLQERFDVRIDKDAESAEEVMTRLIRFMREIAVAYGGKNILMITHGAVLRSLLVRLGYATFEELSGTIGNTAYIVLESDGVDFFIKETKGITKKTS